MAKRSALFPPPDAYIHDRLRFENPWWANGHTDAEYRAMSPRLYFDLFFPLVQDIGLRRAVVLMGPRRVGKTVMMHHSVQRLLDKGVPANRICYINIENPIYTHLGLEQLFGFAREATKASSADVAGWYVLFDEIQYLKDWERHLKTLTDAYPKCKFVVSGSAAAALKLKSNESGAGRFTDFLLPPLTFYEYISLRNLSHWMVPAYTTWKEDKLPFFSTTHLRELNQEFLDYINFGGYPEVIFSETIRANPGRFIRSDIIDKVLLRDLPSLYGIQDVQMLNALFSTLTYHSGEEASLEALSQRSGVEKYQLKKYLEYLEAAFLIRVVHRVDDNAKRFKRANFFKVYLTNPSLRSALFSPLAATDAALGSMVETAIYAQWMHREGFSPWYVRWPQGEVDLVALSEKTFKPQWAVEIKWGNRAYENSGQELKPLLQFCEKHGLDAALVTTLDQEGTHSTRGIHLHFLPAALYAYTVGDKSALLKASSDGY